MAIDLTQTVEQILNDLDARMTAAEAGTTPPTPTGFTFDSMTASFDSSLLTFDMAG